MRIGARAGMIGGLALAVFSGPSMASAQTKASVPIAVYGNRTTIELAPVLLAAERSGTTVKMGGVNNLTGDPGAPGYSSDGLADVATNAETQALRASVKNPNIRIVMTV